MKLEFSKTSVHDLIRLRDFIAKNNPSAARRVSEKLRGAIQNLVDTPQIGRPVENLPGDVRELIFGKYIVRYEVYENCLYILRVWHGKEDASGFFVELT